MEISLKETKKSFLEKCKNKIRALFVIISFTFIGFSCKDFATLRNSNALKKKVDSVIIADNNFKTKLLHIKEYKDSTVEYNGEMLNFDLEQRKYVKLKKSDSIIIQTFVYINNRNNDSAIWQKFIDDIIIGNREMDLKTQFVYHLDTINDLVVIDQLYPLQFPNKDTISPILIEYINLIKSGR